MFDKFLNLLRGGNREPATPPAQADAGRPRTEAEDADPAQAASLLWVDNVLTLIRHGHKHNCTECGLRNDIDNLRFCAKCMSSYCWQCGRGLTHCRCGQPIRSIDDWIKLAREARPGCI